ncbi:hypothetical protein [Photobacterium damselae]|uniref:hypothetical protein n=1 Tax=Photobacterium damselae TaxID=38293 RepID=UPI00370A3D8A
MTRMNEILLAKVEDLAAYKLGLINEKAELIKEPASDLELSTLSPVTCYALALKRRLVLDEAAKKELVEYSLDSLLDPLDEKGLYESVSRLDVYSDILKDSELSLSHAVDKVVLETQCAQIAEKYTALNPLKRKQIILGE